MCSTAAKSGLGFSGVSGECVYELQKEDSSFQRPATADSKSISVEVHSSLGAAAAAAASDLVFCVDMIYMFMHNCC